MCDPVLWFSTSLQGRVFVSMCSYGFTICHVLFFGGGGRKAPLDGTTPEAQTPPDYNKNTLGVRVFKGENRRGGCDMFVCEQCSF